jgi:peptidoglycan/xylan/chitin deacetylase (PgdA/CDA1 family)
MSKRELAARFLGNRLTGLAWRSPGTGARALRILAYHRVLDDDPASFDFDEEVISATTESFYDQMRFARSNFDVISFEELRRIEMEGRRVPARALIITFDDGYRDNYTNAFPVLKEMRLTATIFLATAHIGERKLFWWDAISYAAKHTPRGEALLPEISAAPFALRTPAERRALADEILRWIKQVPESMKREFLEKLAARLEVDLSGWLAEGMHLTWEEVNLMSRHGIEFGSHTVTHPILANVDEAQLEREIVESKQTIERKIGKPITAFAYPVGGRSRFNSLAQQAVARAGFSYAASYENGVAATGDFDRYAMPRIHVERGQSLSLFRANLMFPQLMLRSDQSIPVNNRAAARPRSASA